MFPTQTKVSLDLEERRGKRGGSLLQTRNETQAEAEQERKNTFHYSVNKFVPSVSSLGKCHSLFAQCDGKAG